MTENDKLYSNLVKEISACVPKWTKKTHQATNTNSVENVTEFDSGVQSLSVLETKRARTAALYIRVDAPENPR